MAHSNRTGRTAHRRLGLLVICCALLLVAAGCGDDESIFTDGPGGSSDNGTTSPGGFPGSGDNGDNGDTGTGSNPGDSAVGLPDGAQVYLGFDLGAVPDLQRLMDAFAALDPGALTDDLGAAAGTDAPGVGEAVEGAEEAQDALACVAESLGLDAGSLPEWLGNEASLGLYDMEVSADDSEVSEPNGIALVEVDDQAAAAAALPGIISSIGTCTGTSLTESAYGGVTIYQAAAADGGQPMAIALVEGYAVAGIGTGMVERAIDLGDGPSLADNPAFTEVLEALPSGRHLTGYLGADLLQQAAASAMGAASETGGLSLPPGLDPTQALSAMRGIGLAGTMLDEGIRVEMVTVGQLQTDVSSGEVGDTNLPDQLPADAIGFFGIGEFDVDAMWGGLMEVLAQIPAEEGQGIDETLAMLGTMLGVDIESDIIGQMTGEIGVGLLPATAGSLVTGSGINLGIIAVMGVEDPGAMAGTVESLAQGIGVMSGGAPAAPRPFDGGTLYALSGEEGEIALFGMAGDHMVITTHESHAAALLAGGDRLAGSARYAEGISGLTGGRPMMYLDIAALISALNLEPAEAAAMAPLHSVAMTGQMDGDISRAVIFARIDY